MLELDWYAVRAWMAERHHLIRAEPEWLGFVVEPGSFAIKVAHHAGPRAAVSVVAYACARRDLASVDPRSLGRLEGLVIDGQACCAREERRLLHLEAAALEHILSLVVARARRVRAEISRIRGLVQLAAGFSD
jgi:hypothetical protein